jgi:hypothetical protein
MVNQVAFTDMIKQNLCPPWGFPDDQGQFIPGTGPESKAFF